MAKKVIKDQARLTLRYGESSARQPSVGRVDPPAVFVELHMWDVLGSSARLGTDSFFDVGALHLPLAFSHTDWKERVLF